MGPSPSPRNLPNPLSGVRSDHGTRSKTSKREAAFSEVTQKGRRDAGAPTINEAAAHAASSHKQEEELSSPLRLALARRSVKRKIFTFMDQGEKKTDIESRTGLSHQCIKWHRHLWRTECSHPRPQSKKILNKSSRRAHSPSTRSERLSRKRPSCDGKGDFSVAGERNSGKRQRKHPPVKQSIGRSVSVGTEMPEPGGGNRAERGTKVTIFSTDKENVPGKDEAMMMSVLPFRDLKP